MLQNSDDIDPDAGDEDTLLIEDQRFSIVPEWAIDAELSDAAFRVYALLLRYGNGSGRRMPSRATLARRTRRSKDSIDRTLRELTTAGVVRVERRHNGTTFLSNRYFVRTADPSSARTRRSEGGRNSAATPVETARGGRTGAATPGRTAAARVAADLRPDREKFTERTPPPPAASPPTPSTTAPPRSRTSTAAHDNLVAPLLADCGISDLAALAERCANSRRALGKPTTRWAAPCLATAIQLAVRTRGWPTRLVVPALLAVASDPHSESPARLAEAGPWWDTATETPTAGGDDDDLAWLEARLDDVAHWRPGLQAQARAELAAERLPVTRATVIRRACELLDRRLGGDAA